MLSLDVIALVLNADVINNSNTIVAVLQTCFTDCSK